MMIAMQIICVVVVLIGTLDIILHNVGEPWEGSLGTLTRIE
ncbi:hypothetical protein SEEN176_01357 [Salmonella enterica subsp. enterica serovar Newport str. CVM 4176]|nr:hypothetical protein SEEN176_01357 [Salmonella enterica subsp. enterica serovar Newport str. CVM 4176]